MINSQNSWFCSPDLYQWIASFPRNLSSRRSCRRT